MKKLILLFAILFTLQLGLYGADKYRSVEQVLVFDRTMTLDSLGADTLTSGHFKIHSDTLSFVLEIFDSDSVTSSDPETTTRDSTAVTAKIRIYTPSGLTDTTAWANLETAVSKGATDGLAAWGSPVSLKSSEKIGTAKLVVQTSNLWGSSQQVRVRIYAVKRFRGDE